MFFGTAESHLGQRELLVGRWLELVVMLGQTTENLPLLGSLMVLFVSLTHDILNLDLNTIQTLLFFLI